MLQWLKEKIDLEFLILYISIIASGILTFFGMNLALNDNEFNSMSIMLAISTTVISLYAIGHWREFTKYCSEFFLVKRDDETNMRFYIRFVKKISFPTIATLFFVVAYFSASTIFGVFAFSAKESSQRYYKDVVSKIYNNNLHLIKLENQLVLMINNKVDEQKLKAERNSDLIYDLINYFQKQLIKNDKNTAILTKLNNKKINIQNETFMLNNKLNNLSNKQTYRHIESISSRYIETYKEYSTTVLSIKSAINKFLIDMDNSRIDLSKDDLALVKELTNFYKNILLLIGTCNTNKDIEYIGSKINDQMLYKEILSLKPSKSKIELNIKIEDLHSIVLKYPTPFLWFMILLDFYHFIFVIYYVANKRRFIQQKKGEKND